MEVSSNGNSGDMSGEFQGKKGKFISFFIPEDEPGNFIRVPPIQGKLPLTPCSSCSRNASPSSSRADLPIETTPKYGFKELCLRRLDEKKVPENEQNTQKRRKVNLYGSIVNNVEDFEEDTPKKHKKPNQSRKQNVATICDDDNDEEKEDDESNRSDKDNELCESDKSNDEEDDYENISPLNPPLNERQGLIHLRNVWSELNSPVSEKELQGRFFGAIYYADMHKKKKPKLFVGKLLRRYLADVDGPTVSVDLDCLELAIGSPKILSEPPAHLGKDIGTFDVFNIIAGPLEASFRGGNKWNVPAYPAVVETFKVVLKLQREENYRHLYKCEI